MTPGVNKKTTAKPKAKQKAVPRGKVGRVRRKGGVDSEQSPASAQASEETSKLCINCGGPLLFVEETRLCGKCNTAATQELAAALHSAVYSPEDSETQFIECHGASVLDEKTGQVIEGVKFIDHPDGSYEVTIIKRQVFPPSHRKRRMVKREAFGKIRRCQACQDYTVRLRRKEGVDFCVPSREHPHRKKLKSVDYISHIERS